VHRVVGALLAVGGIAIVLASCDPAVAPNDPQLIEMNISVGPHGSGGVRLGFGQRPSRSELLRIGSDLKESVFVGHDFVVSVDPNDPGYPFLDLDSHDVFAPGPHPEVRIDAARLCRELLVAGYTKVEVSLAAPSTPHSWHLTPSTFEDGSTVGDCNQVPSGTLELSPQPWRWWIETVLLLFPLTANLVMLRLRGRPNAYKRMVIWGFVAFIPTVAFFAGGGDQTENLIVHGDAHGAVASMLTNVHFLALALGALAIVQLRLQRAADLKVARAP
jgi:hypothetical protein